MAKINKGARYEIHRVGNADCTDIGIDVLESTDDEQYAQKAVDRYSNSPFGAAILDTETDLIDYGYGFGKPVPEIGKDGYPVEA